MKLFDGRVFIGRDITMHPFQPEADGASISAMLEKYQVDKALVTSFQSVNLDFHSGNELTFEVAAQDDRLVPCPVVLPEIAVGSISMEDFITELIEKGARAVAYYPGKAGIAHSRLVYGSLLATLEQYRIPLIIPALELSLERLADILRDYPELKIIYSGASYRIGYSIYPLMKAFSNLFLNIATSFFINQGIEEIVSRIGPEQLVYASKFPLVEPGASITYLAYAKITEQEKEMIGFYNMQRLIEEVVV